MPSFLFRGDEPRTFPHLSLDVEPGQVVDVAENPDPRWFDPTDAPPTEPITEPEPETVEIPKVDE